MVARWLAAPLAALLCSAWIGDDGALPAVVAPVRPRPAAPPPTLPPETRFPFVAKGQDLWIASEGDLPLQRLLDSTTSARDRTIAWLESGGARVPAKEPLRAVLCAQKGSIREVERQYRLRDGWQLRDGASFYPDRGGYYSRQRMIVLEAPSLDSMEWLLAHEGVHSVLWDLGGWPSDVLNEGLAELIPHWIFRTHAASPEDAHAIHDDYSNALARAAESGDVPSLESLLRLDYDGFHDMPRERLHEALSWGLVKFLVESRDPGIRGRFPLLLARHAGGSSAWDAARATYDVALLELRWREQLDRLRGWRSVHSVWSAPGDSIVARVRGASSALCVWERSDAAPGEVRVRYRAGSAVAPELGLGFVVDYRDAEHYTVVSVVKGGAHAVVARRDGKEWGPFDFVRVGQPVRAGDLVALRWPLEGPGELTVGSTVVSFRRPRVDATSTAGLFFERNEGPDDPQAGTEQVFEDVRVQ